MIACISFEYIKDMWW